MKKIWEVPMLEALDVSSTFGGSAPVPKIDGPYTGDYWPMGES